MLRWDDRARVLIKWAVLDSYYQCVLILPTSGKL